MAQAYASGTHTTEPTKTKELPATRTLSTVVNVADPGESTNTRHPGGRCCGNIDGLRRLGIVWFVLYEFIVPAGAGK